MIDPDRIPSAAHNRTNAAAQFIGHFQTLARRTPLLSNVVRAHDQKVERQAQDRAYEWRLQEYLDIMQNAPRMTVSQFKALPQEQREATHIKLAASDKASKGWATELADAAPSLTRTATNVAYFGHEYPGGGAEEYASLQLLHAASPRHTVKPYGLITDDEGKTIGYGMQRLRGETLAAYGSNIPDTIKDSAREMLREVHEAGLVHGDLGWDLFVENGSVTMIDPVAIGPVHPTSTALFDYDRERLEIVLRGLPPPVPQPLA